MTPERRARITEIFRATLERTEAERSAYLDFACGPDTELRDEVDRLLAQGDEPGPRSAAELAAGAMLAHYRVEAKLGQGGMGAVYRAFDTHLRRPVALKVLPPGRLADQERRHRLIREARAASALNHPNIAYIYDIGEAGGTCYVAMEYVEGDTLRRRMNSPESTLPQLLGYLQQTASALARAHAKGVVHCDLKPENIMVTQDGLVKVLDFGLAKLLERPSREKLGADSHSSAFTRSTPSEPQPGAVEGTVGYMSPEQAEGGTIDERSDIFSFGCLLFEAATRKLPFEGGSLARSLHNLLYEPAGRLSRYCRGAPPALERLVDRCIEKDPARRCRSMEEVGRGLGDVLRAMLDSPPVTLRLKAPYGERRVRPGRRAGGLIPRSARGRVAAAVLAALAVTAGAAAYLRWHPKRAIPSVAVIPFANLRGTPESEYLSDGISESLINALAQLPDVKVIARSSSFRFRGEAVDLKSVARTLGVQALVTGRVTQMGGRLRVSAELVNGADGTQLWGAQYSRGLSALGVLQAEISRDVAGQIRSELTPAERVKLETPAKVKPEAYEFLLRGRYQMRLYTPESRERAVSYFLQALAIDPGFALANAELASSYRLLSGSAILSPEDTMPKAEAAALRALAAEPGLAEAHAALADIRKVQWNWTAAEREYRRALDLSPNLAAAHDGFAIYLSVTGRHDGAIAEIHRARELDPIGLPAAIDAAAVFYNARRFDQALDVLKEASDLDPAAPAIWYWIGAVNGGSGQFAKAVDAYEKAVGFGDDTAATQCYYAYSLARSGKRPQALRILQRLQHSGGFVPPSALALLYAGMNEKERAIQSLQAAYASRDPLLQYMEVEAHFDILRDDPRFRDLAARIGLPR